VQGEVLPQQIFPVVIPVRCSDDDVDVLPLRHLGVRCQMPPPCVLSCMSDADVQTAARPKAPA
jgi:hypothetical protein